MQQEHREGGFHRFRKPPFNSTSELNEGNVLDDSEAECNECDNPEHSVA